MAEKRTARDQAMRYLEYRSRTVSEVEKHLREKEYSQEEIEDCLDFLAACHFVNDEDYCFRYIEYSIEKGRGPIRIRHELSQKGISEQQIALGLEELYDACLQREVALVQAEKVLRLCAAQTRNETYFDGTESETFSEENFEEEKSGRPSEKELAKIARRLSGQGFGGSVVHDVLARLR